MKFKAEIVNCNFDNKILPTHFNCDIHYFSPAHMYVEGKLFYLDIKHIKFLDDCFVLEGFLADEESLRGRLVIELTHE